MRWKAESQYMGLMSLEFGDAIMEIGRKTGPIIAGKGVSEVVNYGIIVRC